MKERADIEMVVIVAKLIELARKRVRTDADFRKIDQIEIHFTWLINQ